MCSRTLQSKGCRTIILQSGFCRLFEHRSHMCRKTDPCGVFPVSTDLPKMTIIIGEILFRSSLRINGLIWSGPAAFPGLRSRLLKSGTPVSKVPSHGDSDDMILGLTYHSRPKTGLSCVLTVINLRVAD